MIIKKKLYPILMILGAGILLYRTISLLFFENGLETLALWVVLLTFIEMLFDLSCIVFSFKWMLSGYEKDQSIVLRLGAFITIFHALRVLIYVLGRIGPWINFDRKQEFRSLTLYSDDIFWLYFAGIMSVLGIIGVILIWLIRKSYLKKMKKTYDFLVSKD